MTLHELSQLYYLRREIRHDEARLRELETAAGSCTAGFGGASGGVPRDRVGDYAAAIADLREAIAAKRLACLREQLRLEQYIAGVGDSVVRLAMSCRFISGLTWSGVARRLSGGHTADSCRMLVQRYLEKN